MTVLTVIVLVYSKLKNKNATIFALLISLVLSYSLIYKDSPFLEIGNEHGIYLTIIFTLKSIIFNVLLLTLLYGKRQLIIHLCNAAIVLIVIIK